MERIVIKKKVCYAHRSLETRCTHAMQGYMGSTSIGQEAEGVRKMWARAFIVVSVGRNRPGRANRLRVG